MSRFGRLARTASSGNGLSTSSPPSRLTICATLRDAMQSALLSNQHDGWLQDAVRNVGSYAQTSTPAYILTALFALSTPFGFASPAQAAAEAAAELQRQQQFAKASAAAAARGSSGLLARLVANVHTQRAAAAQTQTSLRTLPPFWQLAFFAAAFGTGGYIIDEGDTLNGSGVVTAWSLTYLLFKTAPSIRQLPRNPLALSLSAAVLTLGLGIHGSHYFDRTRWRGAIPSLASPQAAVGERSRSSLVSFDTVGNTARDQTPKPILAATSDITPTTESAAPATNVQAISPPASSGLARNNDDARSVAFLRRQGATAAPLIP